MAKGSGSRKSKESKRKKGEEEEVMSKMSKAYKASTKEKECLRGNEAIQRYIVDFNSRDMLSGRYVDFVWMNSEHDIHLDSWINIAGWKEFCEVKETIHPKLVRILYSNLDTETMISHIGGVEVKLDTTAWAHAFGLIDYGEMEEAQIMSVPKEEIFRNLNGKRGQEHKLWINSNELPKKIDDRLAVIILMNIMIPKRGSKEQIREEEGRIIYALKYGLDYNMPKEIVKRIRQVFFRKSTPLCYPMQLMKMMKLAGVNLDAAGDSKLEELPPSLYINEKTLNRLGFKKDGFHWDYAGKGKNKFMGENVVEEEREQEEPIGEPSTIPDPQPSTKPAPQPTFIPTPQPTTNPDPQTSTYTPSQSQPHISHHLAIFEAQLLPKIAQILASQLNPIHTSIQRLETRLDEVQTEIRTLATFVHQPPPTQSPRTEPFPSPEPEPIPTHKPTPTPTPQPSPPRTTSPPKQPTPKQTSTQPPNQPILIDLTDPMNPPSYDPADLTFERIFNLPKLPTSSKQQPQPILSPSLDSDSESTDTDPIPEQSPEPISTQEPEPQPLPPIPNPTPNPSPSPPARFSTTYTRKPKKLAPGPTPKSSTKTSSQGTSSTNPTIFAAVQESKDPFYTRKRPRSPEDS